MRAVTVAVRGDVPEERDLAEVPTRPELGYDAAVLRHLDLAVGDDVEAVACVALPNDDVAGVDAERHEPAGEMLERPPGSGAKMESRRGAELLCLGCRSAGIDSGHGSSEHDHEGGKEDAATISAVPIPSQAMSGCEYGADPMHPIQIIWITPNTRASTSSGRCAE